MTSPEEHRSDEVRAKRQRGIKTAKRSGGQSAFVIIWEFQVRKGMERKFESVYGANGDWVRLFKQNECYIQTELIRDLRKDRTYLTLEFWTSQEAYEAFRKQHFAKYKAIDQKCEIVTSREREVGRFVRVSNE
jgi:heme-degrading monooxygenase HmoA